MSQEEVKELGKLYKHCFNMRKIVLFEVIVRNYMHILMEVFANQHFAN